MLENTSHLEFLNTTSILMKSNDSEAFAKEFASTTTIFFCFIIVIVGIAANGVALLMVLCNHLNLANDFILLLTVNLALVDFINIILLPFIATQWAVYNWQFGQIGCKIIYFLDQCVIHISIFTITFMTFQRLIAVVWPYYYRSQRYNRIFLIILVIWIASFLLASPNLFILEMDHTAQTCNTIAGSISWLPAYFLVLFFIDYLCPLILIVTMYVVIIHRVKRQENRFATRASEKKRKSHKKVTLLVLAIVISFFICYTPFYLLQFAVSIYFRKKSEAERLDPMTTYVARAHTVCTLLIYTNSMLNPFFYFILSEKYKRSFVRLFKSLNIIRSKREGGHCLQTDMDTSSTQKHQPKGTPYASSVSPGRYGDDQELPQIPHLLVNPEEEVELPRIMVTSPKKKNGQNKLKQRLIAVSHGRCVNEQASHQTPHLLENNEEKIELPSIRVTSPKKKKEQKKFKQKLILVKNTTKKKGLKTTENLNLLQVPGSETNKSTLSKSTTMTDHDVCTKNCSIKAVEETEF